MALTTIYIMDSTDGETSFTIQPRSFDGVGGIQLNTDLTLYGNSTPNWGERYNENFYRLLENFAVGQDAYLDLNEPTPPTPLTSTVSERPDHENYVIGSMSFPPNVFYDGTGINNPTRGQTWFNTTDRKLYVYTDNEWKSAASASTTQPSNPTSGDLWYDNSVNLLKYYRNSTGTWVTLEADSGAFVLTAGDTMTGVLQFGNHLFFDEGGGNAGINPDIRATGDLLLSAENSVDLIFDDDNLGSGIFRIYKGAPNVTSASSVFTIENNGTLHTEISNYETLVTDPNDIPNKQYVDTAVSGGTTFVQKTGDTMTGALQFGASPFLLLGEGNGNALLGPDIRATGDILISANSSTNLIFDDNNDNIGVFRVFKGAQNLTSASSVFTIENNGTLHTDIANYETLVTDDDDIPNKKYVDDTVATSEISAGFVFVFPNTIPPAGFFVCNGAAISRTTYATLFTHIGTLYGAGDGSTTFNLPDLRGEFIRGHDAGRGIDAGRVIGSFQSDDLGSHSHEQQHGPGFNAKYPITAFAVGFGGGTADDTWHTSQTGLTGSADTRPRNVAMTYCIKY